MSWKSKVFMLAAVLLCTGVLVAATGSQPAPNAKSADEASAGGGSTELATNPVPVIRKTASLPDEKRPDGWIWEEAQKESEGKEEPPDTPATPESIFPVETDQDAEGAQEGREVRAACLGDKDINGAGVTGWTYMTSTSWHDRRCTTIYLASEFACSDGGQINGIRYYVSTVSGMALTNFTIRMRHTTLSAYTTPYCFENTGWTICYQATTTLSTPTGWKTFTFTTPFTYNGTSNLEVDVSFNNAAYTGGGAVYSFTGTGNRTKYAYCDSCNGDPLNWTCGSPNPTMYGTTSVPRAQFIFPPPSTGACCVDYVCVATDTQPECTALGGTWFGGQSCPAFYCPPWNDNCGAVTPVTLTPDVPETFTGDTRGATNDCASFAGGQVWHAITLPTGYANWDVTLDYCGTTPAFGNAWLNFATGCPCTGVTAAGTYETTTCGDGNLTIRWRGLAAGTYYYPVLMDPTLAFGPYTINVVAVPAYCPSYPTSSADSLCKEVHFVTINNDSGVACATYSDFTTMATEVVPGRTYPISVVGSTCGGCYGKWTKVYIDWNQDLDFTDPGEQVFSSTLPTPCPNTASGNVTVPVTALIGSTRMRVVVREGGTELLTLPCGTYTWGETEDYTIDVKEPPDEGACCNGGSCAVLPEDICTNGGGIFKGAGSLCDPNPCTGACCFDDGSCSLETPDDCGLASGTYWGDATDCDPNPCPQPGANCDNPALVSLTPGFGILTRANQTNCGMGSDYQDTCLGSYDGGEDIIYEVTVTGSMNIAITLDPKGTTWPGFLLDDTCPPGGTGQCILFKTQSGGTPMTSDCTHLEPGVYTVMVDTYPSPYCIPNFDLTFTECTLPTGRCCYEPWPNCVDNITAFDCQTLYDGDWTLNLTCASECPIFITNEDCGTALGITTACYDVMFNNDLSTASPPAPSCGGGSSTGMTQNDVWFSYTPTAECALTVSFTTPSYDGVMGIYTGPDCSSLTEAACLDTPDDPGTWSTTASIGTTYWFQVGDWGTYEGGGLTTFDLKCLTPGATGACCTCGACEVLTADACAAAGGTYLCDGTTCDPNPCPQPEPGDDCCAPIVVDLPADLPYTDPNQYTCGRGNDYADTCMGSYDGGEDILYELTVTEPVCVNIVATGNTTSNNWIGIGLDNVCPLGNPCIAVASSSGTVATMANRVLMPGTYTVMVDTYPAPACLTDFTLTIAASTGCAQGACCDETLGCYVTYGDACTASGGTFAGNGTTCSGLDCNTNGIDDLCDILGGMPDCQPDGIPDDCQLVGNDLDGNGVPDECDPDCNENGIPDVCDISCDGACASVPTCGQSEDCQTNGIPDECEVGGKARVTYVWDDGTHENSIGLTNGGEIAWMNHFVVVAGGEGIISISLAWGSVPNGTATTVYVWSDPNGDGNPSDGLVLGSAPTVVANADADILTTVAVVPAAAVGPVGTSFFAGAMISHAAGYYPASVDQDSVLNGQSWIAGDSTYNLDPNDLDGGDVAPVNIDTIAGLEGNWLVRAEGGAAGGGDCNGNGIPDVCDVPPICTDPYPACSRDCNTNLIPDECEDDCNNNDIADECDIAAGTSGDCQPDGIPDECQLVDNDCNGNFKPDDCDLVDHDCNANGIVDECDITAGTSEDCQGDGTPDECQLFDEDKTVVVNESFEGTFPPTGWTTVVTNPGYTWHAYTGVPPLPDGVMHANCVYDPALAPQDEWLLTPALTLSGPVTLTGWTMGSVYWGITPYDNYDVEAWIVIGAVGGGDDILIAQLDEDNWVTNWVWEDFSYTFPAPAGTFRIGLRYVGVDGAQGGLDLIVVDGLTGPPANDCNTNGVPDECDINASSGGTSLDCDVNWIPDECELCGDLDNDGDVDGPGVGTDYAIFRAAFGHSIGEGVPPYNPCADYNHNGVVGQPDYATWRQCYYDANGKVFVIPPKPPTKPKGPTGPEQPPPGQPQESPVPTAD
ncbi:MAG: GEVED domain-containing protein [Planctomycetota bacterium]